MPIRGWKKTPKGADPKGRSLEELFEFVDRQLVSKAPALGEGKFRQYCGYCESKTIWEGDEASCTGKCEARPNGPCLKLTKHKR